MFIRCGTSTTTLRSLGGDLFGEADDGAGDALRRVRSGLLGRGCPYPVGLQAQLTPRLFGSGSDDSGKAAVWLSERAVGLMKTWRGGRPALKASWAPD